MLASVSAPSAAARDSAALALVAGILVVACGGDAGPTALRPDAPADAHRATAEWSSPEHLGDAVNSRFADAHPTVSTDQLSLYFTGGQGLGGEGGRDLWVSRRVARSDPWGAPVNLGPVVNSGSHDDNPTLSPDGRSLYFASDRDGLGGFDLFVSHREDPDDDLGWGAPVNLGSPINSAADETDAAVVAVAGPGGQALYFASSRGGTADLYAAVRGEDGAYEPAVLIPELNSEREDLNPTVSRDGRTIYFASNRLESLGMHDLWVATRQSPTHPWSTPVNLGPGVNGAKSNDVGPDLSADGRTLYFASTFREGNVSVMYDLWRTTRRE